MATAYQTPGVHYETIDASSATIAGIRTDVAGFVGIAERGPVDVPIAVESWRQFEARFGGFTGVGYLAYAVRAFFENGGRRCWCVRVASRKPVGGVQSAAAELVSAASTPVWRIPVWRIEASSGGTWGNRLKVRVIETRRSQTVGDFAASTPMHTVVASTEGFVRGTLVRLSQQAGGAVVYKVVSGVDPIRRRLIWMMERPEERLPYDRPLTGLDPNRPVRLESVELTIVVLEGGIPAEVYDGISLIPEHPDYGPLVLGAERVPTDRLSERGVPSPPSRLVIVERRTRYGADPLLVRPAPMDVVANDIPITSDLTLTGGRDGLALLDTHDFTGAEEAAGDSDEQKAECRRGIRALGLIDEVSMVAVPDIHIIPEAPPEYAPLPPCIPDPCLPGPASNTVAERVIPLIELPPVFSEAAVHRVQADLVQHCTDKRDRFAILDAPAAVSENDVLGVSAISAWRTRFDSKFAALYHPWIRVVDPRRRASRPTRAIPPSGHVAGEYARTDIRTGVHRAPANGVLGWALDVTARITPAEHGVLNAAGVNVIRPLPGRGLRILGARTTSSDASWRFVNVRRLVIMIMKAVDLATQWAVFEPNSHGTRSKLQLALITFLATLWEHGALTGTSLAEAFFVKCDAENNTPDDVGNARLIVDIGIAPAQPLEFIVLRVWRAGNELEFAETTTRGGRR